MNENEMSISKNIGSFARHLSKLRSRSGYFGIKKATRVFIKKIPFVGKRLFGFVLGVKKTFKNVLYGSNYFESMGLTYLGPIDGNDYSEMENILKEAKKLNESVVVHIKTQKGRGYAPAESAPDKYHGMSPLGTLKSEKKNFSHIAGEALAKKAESDKSVCAVTAAMGVGTGLEEFSLRFPERFFDVGIAEEHATTFAAGLAANGMKPYFAVYSSFLQRAYDNVIHDIALQKLPVTLLVDRAGLNDGDGATHHGIFDVAFLSGIPDMCIYTPITEFVLKKAIDEAEKLGKPCAIRYPNSVENDRVISEFYADGVGDKLGAKSNFDKASNLHAVIITHGKIVCEALKAADILREEGINVGIILLEKIKPYTECAETVASLLPLSPAKLVFLEEEIRNGGMGMILSDTLGKYDVMKNKSVSIMAVDDTFVERRKGESIYESAKISAEHIVSKIKQ
jgi:1-deoxy-D-xylulose-5-phosphate synthase